MATSETLFNLTFEIEAMISIEIGLLTLRTDNFKKEANSEQLRANVDLLEETREQVQQRMITYQQKMARYYNSKIKTRTFRPGDLVLHRVEVSRPLEQGKLVSN